MDARDRGAEARLERRKALAGVRVRSTRGELAVRGSPTAIVDGSDGQGRWRGEGPLKNILMKLY